MFIGQLLTGRFCGYDVASFLATLGETGQYPILLGAFWYILLHSLKTTVPAELIVHKYVVKK